MRISDWSSDVCSSDLRLWHRDRGRGQRPAHHGPPSPRYSRPRRRCHRHDARQGQWRSRSALQQVGREYEVRRRSLSAAPLRILWILLPLLQSEFGREFQRIIDAIGRQQDLRIPKLEIIARTIDEDDGINAAELLEERRNEETDRKSVV